MKWIQNFFTQLWVTFRTTLKTFIAENYLRYSASLSYYTIFSLAPLLIITISLFGYFFGKQAMEGRIFSEIRSQVGDVAAMQIQQMIQHVVLEQDSFVAKVAAIIIIVLGIAAVFTEVQDAINHIWKLKPIPKLDRKKYLIKRVISLGIFSVIGFILVLSLVINLLIDILGNYLIGYFAGAGVFMMFLINRIFIIAVVAVLFTFMFKYVPDGEVKWKDAIKGAVFTSFFFMVGKGVIGYFLGHIHTASTYGAAGSLVVLLLWIYYSSVIIYFGATFTKEYAYLYGGKIVPRSYAVFLETKEVFPH
ncbi:MULTISPECIES: YihY/virulence factor BrkB family protein [Niastella]|uniref:YihY/virulence factor BrkB family protein n=1 Tax=Niastella soli TaxID=2821487 RepID=A0ABS3YVB3_9BACT|nr:YihY/virulence factor BrkB family protein [Niastella soli]MBO9201884.1 YihY/virulence factor BrkB family protein [Niastella soli]